MSSSNDDQTPLSNDVLTGERRLMYELCVRPLQKEIREGFGHINERMARVEVTSERYAELLTKVNDQTKDLARGNAETDEMVAGVVRRLVEIERTHCHDCRERVAAIERHERDRLIREEERATTAATAVQSAEKSLGQQIRTTAILTAVGICVTGTLSFLGWLVVLYLKARP